jgi:hypothetical protein
VSRGGFYELTGQTFSEFSDYPAMLTIILFRLVRSVLRDAPNEDLTTRQNFLRRVRGSKIGNV